jgi:hypothetical protein
MQTYAQTVISNYKGYINQYFASIAKNFSFYSITHYNVTSYISYNGAALWFEPSNIQSFENFNLSNRIESIFGGNFSLYPAFSLPANTVHVSIKGGSFELNNHPFLELGDNATIVLQEILIIQPNFTQSYTCVIMKGSNETSQWTQDNAIADAGTIIYDDAEASFSTSEAVREYYAEPVLTALLESIQNKLVNDSSYTASEWLADMQNVENVATNTYHLTNANAFINGIIAFLNAKITGTLPTFPTEPTQTSTRTIFGISDPTNWIYSTLCASYLVVLYAFFLIFEEIQRKLPESKGVRFLTSTVFLEIVLGAIAGEQLFVNYPYNSQLSLPQIIFIIAIWFFGFLGLYALEKKLVSRRLTRENNSNTAKREAQDKTDSTPQTEKMQS